MNNNDVSWMLLKLDNEQLETMLGYSFLNKFQSELLTAYDIQSDKAFLMSFMQGSDELIYSYDGLTDPNELKKGLNVLRRAIESGKKVFINGDPDADGITATTIVVAVLLYFDVDVRYDFPIRAKEGHGLQLRLIDKAVDDDVSLIITTDCGTKDLEAIDYARSKGIDVIVTDHHIVGDTLPNVTALINPHMLSEDSEMKSLCGAGVIFKFMMALVDDMDASLSNDVFEFLLIMTALGTLSDRMSLRLPMNRALVRDGIDCLNRVEFPGIKALKKISGFKQNIQITRHKVEQFLQD